MPNRLGCRSLLLLLLLTGSSVFGFAQDNANASASVPPLIPRQVFDSAPEHDLLTISPDARQLAYIAPDEKGVANIWVEETATHVKRMVSRSQRGIGYYQWAFDSNHLLYHSDENGNEDYHLFSIDLKTGTIRDLTPFQGVRAEQVLLSPSKGSEVLVGLNLRDRRLFDIYRVNLETGATILDTENPGDVIGWTADANLVIRAATAFNENLETVVRVRDTPAAPWRDLLKIPFEQAPFLGQVNGGNIVVDFSADGKKLIVGSSKNSPTIRMVELDAGTGKVLRELGGDPRADLWQVFATRFILLSQPKDHHVQAVAFNYLKPEWRVIDPAVEADFKYLAALQPGAFFISSQDLEGSKWAVLYFADKAPTSFYLYDRKTRHAELMFQDRPRLKQYTLAEEKALTIPARDGFPLVSYLTLPPSGSSRGLPLVMLVHGGPWARDEWGFDPQAQFLANRGYAVLQGKLPRLHHQHAIHERR